MYLMSRKELKKWTEERAKEHAERQAIIARAEKLIDDLTKSLDRIEAQGAES